MFEVSNFGADNQAAKACLQWYNIQKFYMFPTGIMEDLGIPCPCNVASASIDENFFFDYNSYCSFSLYRKPTTGFVQVNICKDIIIQARARRVARKFIAKAFCFLSFSFVV